MHHPTLERYLTYAIFGALTLYPIVLYFLPGTFDVRPPPGSEELLGGGVGE